MGDPPPRSCTRCSLTRCSACSPSTAACDSVAITVSKAVTPWGATRAEAPPTTWTALSAVDQLSIIDASMSPCSMIPRRLVRHRPNTGTVAGAVALIDSIIDTSASAPPSTSSNTGFCSNSTRCATPARYRPLLNYVGESAGLGVNIMATVQASSHF